MNGLPFAQLQVFLAVAQHRSFSAAARELGVSRSAVSQSVRQLEELLRVTLVTRTTRSVSLTDAGRRLANGTGPAFAQTAAILIDVATKPGDPVGKLRISVPRVAMPFVIEPVLPTFRARFPRIEVELVVEDRLVDIVSSGFDAGVRDGEFVERDMVRVRLTKPVRYVVVATPDYLKRRGIPQRPEDLLVHECLIFRSPTSGAAYAWEFERGKKKWRVPVRGAMSVNDGLLCATFAKQGLGLAYIVEPYVQDEIRDGSLQLVLESYAPTTPGYYLYFPNRSQQTLPLRHFIETAKDLLFPRRTT